MRDKVTAAINGIAVPGITPDTGIEAHEYEPRTVSAWQGWPVWVASEFISRCGINITWHVVVALPAGDVETFTPAGDALIVPIRNALEAVGSVERVEPIALRVADQQTRIPALRFTTTTPDGI